MEILEQVIEEMAPLSKRAVETTATVMAIRNILREALLKYNQKLEEQNRELA